MRININGSIVANSRKKDYQSNGLECFSPADLKLPINGESLEVYINSGGGDVYSGSEISSKLKDYKGNVTVKIVGLCASIATVIALSGDTIEMSQTAVFMIHEAMAGVFGNKKKIEQDLRSLDTINDMLLNVYHKRTGLPIERLKAMMAEETWLTCDEAIELGFVDRELTSQGFSRQLVASVAEALPTTIQYDYMEMIRRKFENQIRTEVKAQPKIPLHIQHMYNWAKKVKVRTELEEEIHQQKHQNRLKELREQKDAMAGFRNGDCYIENGQTKIYARDYETYSLKAQGLLKSQ
ncbi:head maturation protease, ClpP-related [Streptococcus pneumoniae]